MGVLVPDNTDDTYLELSALLAKFKAKIDSLWEQYKTSDKKRNTLAEINILNDELEQFKNSILAMRKIRSRNGSVIFEKSIDYGYAHTIHKSQGGTYNDVMILGDTIDTFKDKESKQQLRYVAMSRAKHKVTVVTNHELGDPDIVDMSNTSNILV
jgi:superfamily I DNA/RNA helicase